MNYQYQNISILPEKKYPVPTLVMLETCVSGVMVACSPSINMSQLWPNISSVTR